MQRNIPDLKKKKKKVALDLHNRKLYHATNDGSINIQDIGQHNLLDGKYLKASADDKVTAIFKRRTLHLKLLRTAKVRMKIEAILLCLLR